jgi:predicted RNase H-like HicB family nuclease
MTSTDLNRELYYPIAIEPGDETHAFGVVVPDLPGCFSAGDTLDEALTNAEAAILAWIDAALDSDEAIPQPSSLDVLRAAYPEYAGWIWAVVRVDPARLDAAARAVGETRSGYIAAMTLRDGQDR